MTLKVLNKDNLKVGDTVGIVRHVRCGWGSFFRHTRVYQAKIIRITPKRTKFETDKFGVHDKYEIFYEYDSNAEKENEIAEQFEKIRDSVYAIEDFKSTCGLRSINDEDIQNLSEHLRTVADILKKYKKQTTGMGGK